MINQLDANTTLLTPNRRLSATLLKKYNQAQVDAGKTCWRSVAVLPFTSWIQQLWDDYSAAQLDNMPLLLTSQQELILWEEILQQFPANETLLQLSETAELAKTAWGTLKQWQINLTHPALATTDDSQAFLSWAIHFQSKCRENNWLDINSMMQLIGEKILVNKIKLSKCIIVTGFTELSPLQKYLFSCCEQIGTQVIFDTQTDPTTLAQRISLSDEETEIRTMARWAKSLMDSNASSVIASEAKQPSLFNTDFEAQKVLINAEKTGLLRFARNDERKGELLPSLTIGCVVPNLEKKRDLVSTIFSEVFCEGLLYRLDCTTQPFNITAGKSLAAYPIVHDALQLLGLNKSIMTSEQVSHLLLSPFLGDAEQEQTKRAQMDARLRKANRKHSQLKKLIHRQEKINLYTSCPRLAKRIENFLTVLDSQPTLQSMSKWSGVFIEALNTLGWPGERSINSQEYQIVQRWLELLEEYQTFDKVLPKKNYQTALRYLTRLTANSVFQPQGTDTSVQVLGVLEATALPFDHTWVMGFDDSVWPPAAKPNPFVPHRLQASLKMPHSCAEHEFEYSKRLTEQLLQSTSHIIFSHAKNNLDCELRVSPLVSHLPEVTEEQLNLSPFISLAEQCRQGQLIETLQDSQAPAVTLENTHGGASLFRLQAACPFKAFAEIRLHARPLETPVLGLRAEDRGKITHKALELAWLDIKTSDTLQHYTEIELKSVLTDAITKALQETLDSETIASRYLALETERLQALLWDWFQIEKSRPPFKVVAQEEERSIQIANLPIQLRIDRIDELPDGSQLIIDYKTGKNNQIKYWFGDRLEEPQLPLYCVTAMSMVEGIAFAEINPTRLTLKGISKKNMDAGAIKPLFDTHYYEGRSWEQQILTWQQSLEKLGAAFAEGKAEVDPKHTIETCGRCQLQAFCRISDHHFLLSDTITEDAF